MQLDLRETTVRTVVREASTAQTMARHQLRRELDGDERASAGAYSTAVYNDPERATLLSGILGTYDRAHDAWCTAQRMRTPPEREAVLWQEREQAWNAVIECLAALHQHLVNLDTLEPADVSEPPQWREDA